MAEGYEQVRGAWEESFESPRYGRWCGFVDAVVYAFTDCGDLSRGFARVYCDVCRTEYLLALSCTRRGLCPSRAAKLATKRRGEAFDAQDFLARLLQQIPALRLHLVRYYGHYATAARAKRWGRLEEAVASEA